MDRQLVITGLFGGLLLLGGPPGARAAVDESAPPPAAVPAAQPAAAAAVQSPRFPTDQLDQLVAPVALYPDPLLMQVLIASSYPLEVVEAERWRTQNASLKDDALDKALEAKDWDPSVEGLTHFPDLLKRMSDNLDWTKDMGDAFLAQKDDVLDAVQRMRRRAQEAGKLQTTKEQTVTKEVVKEKETIIIQPAQPQVVYVPTYPPTVYGSYAPPQPYYPAVYGYTGGQMATASLVSFGLGVGVGALISNGCDWGDHDVHVNNNYYGGGGGGGGGKNNNSNNNVNIDNSKNVNINKSDRSQKTWQHNPEHRRNVGYRDPGTAKRYGGQGGTAGAGRAGSDPARGYDRGGAGSRPGSSAQRPASRPTTVPANAAQRPDRAGGGGGAGRPSGDRGATTQAKAQGGGRQDAFSGYGNGRGTQQASQRGAASTGDKSWAGSSQGGQRASASGGGSRGGGGGSGGRKAAGGGSRGGGGGGGGGRKR